MERVRLCRLGAKILYTDAGVLHMAMIDIPDVRLGERNCLCIVPKGDAVPTLDEFVAFLRDQVADYKLPEAHSNGSTNCR